MLAAVIWGLIQGLTEFLPVSSSGHLIIVPAFLSEMGFDVPVPSLAVSTVIHLGTLAAVLIYYRREVMAVLRFRTNPEGRKLALLVGIGTIPALIGLPLADEIEGMQQSVAAVGWQIVATGVILVIGQRVATGVRRLMEGRIPDAVVVGVAQAIALIPGISRSGVAIAAGNLRKFEPGRGRPDSPSCWASRLSPGPASASCSPSLTREGSPRSWPSPWWWRAYRDIWLSPS